MSDQQEGEDRTVEPQITCAVEVPDLDRRRYCASDTVRVCGKPAAPLCAEHLAAERESNASANRAAAAELERLRHELIALASGVSEYERGRAVVLAACARVRDEERRHNEDWRNGWRP